MRKATVEDALTVTKMFFDYWRENEEFPLQRRFTMDPEFVHTTITEILAGHIGFIDNDGVVLGRVVNTWFGPNPVAEGVLWYVRPRARGGLLAWRLLKAFDQEARQRGAIVGLHAIHNPRMHKTVSGLLEKNGFSLYSFNYLKEYGHERLDGTARLSAETPLGGDPRDHLSGGGNRF